MYSLMRDFRSFAAVYDATHGEIVLDEQETHHLARVNRAGIGDRIVVFNGRGVEWICELATVERRKARLVVLKQLETPRPPFQIILAQALPKGKAFEQILRQATEIGVSRIVPIVTKRSEIRLDDARRSAKREKWGTALIEAAKQSGNSYLPRIEPVQELDEFLASDAGVELKLIASLQPGAPLLQTVLKEAVNDKPPHMATWLIGPEGDFTPDEISAAEQAGFHQVTLGPIVLRCETAVVYALAILTHELRHAFRRCDKKSDWCE